MIHNLDNALYAAVALGAGPYLFFRGFRDLRVMRLVEDTPTAKIRSMAMGLVEVLGTVQPRSRTLSPFTGAACAYWEVDIAARQSRRGGWTVIHRAQSKQPFYLEDETGLALVYPEGARCTVTFPREEVCAGLNLPQLYADYISEHAGIGLTLGRLSVMRFRERIIEPGQVVYVLGSAFPRAQAVSLNDEEVLQATGTDDPVASRLRDFDQRVAAVIRKGQNDPAFIISQESELGVRMGLGWKSIAQLVAGPALSLMGLAYWLTAVKMGKLP